MNRRGPGRALAWWLAVRPWSFTISLAPVLAGTGLAALDGYPPNLLLAGVALLACILIHAGTNLQNDVGDFRRGAALIGRVGPPRVTTQGWLPASQVQATASLSFALAFLPGVYLVVHGGWPIVAIGLASVAAGAAYTAGPRPIAYSGWGEAFVIVFFGLLAVGGMYYLHTGTLSAAALVAGAALGLLAAAVLVVNNLRDIDADRRIGKNTLAVRLGRRASAWEYAALMHVPFALAIAVSLLEREAWLLAPLALLPWATTLAQRVAREPAGAWLNAALGGTAKLGLAFALLLSAGAALVKV
ncbi:MAG TPA: 1,4-dihydroxy-2-naphthoate octaprenyltransferase [Burkholderiales bacterium]|nr:1,4-dihydroxy-2-naphthoate octaprenyltransferase [Burkholderiales bacterium]